MRFALLCFLLLAGCSPPPATGSPSDYCLLPDHIRVLGITVETDETLELRPGETAEVAVSARLSGRLDREAAVCLRVLDSEGITALPLTVGAVPVAAGERRARVADAFAVTCTETGEVRGLVSETTRSVDPESASLERSSGARVNRLRVQALGGIRTLAGALVGGPVTVAPDRLRVRCVD